MWRADTNSGKTETTATHKVRLKNRKDQGAWAEILRGNEDVSPVGPFSIADGTVHSCLLVPNGDFKKADIRQCQHVQYSFVLTLSYQLAK